MSTPVNGLFVYNNIDPAQVAAAPVGVKVIQLNDSNGNPFSTTQVAQMESGGASLLGYFSLGEAATYMPYFSSIPGAALGPQDPAWPGTYQVAYWTPQWLSIAESSIQTMIKQGYSGVFFDCVSEAEAAWAKQNAPGGDPEGAMVSAVQQLANYAHGLNPNFQLWINAAGAEPLLSNSTLIKTISGAVVESMYYLNGTQAVDSSTVNYVVSAFDAVTKAGKPVIDVEYVSGAAEVANVETKDKANGFGWYVANPNQALDGVDTQGFTASGSTSGGSSSGGSSSGGSSSGSSASAPTVKITSVGGTTSSAAQTVKGTVDIADAGSTVKILDGKTQIGSATVASNGAWSANVTLASQGANVVTATDANAAGTGTSNAVTYTLQSGSGSSSGGATGSSGPMNGVYVLQGVTPSQIASAPVGVKVVEIYDGDNLFSTTQVSQMKSGGGDVLGYFSIGEAENYRSYWSTLPSSTVGPQDPSWPGDYEVAYWTPQWRSVCENYVQTMINQGYNGAFFDVVDEAETPWAQKNAPGGDAEGAMTSLIQQIASDAHARDPNFKIWINSSGAEPMLANNALVKTIDGAYEEQLYYQSPTQAAKAADLNYNVALLDNLTKAGKSVVAVEYVSQASEVASVESQAKADGFGYYIANPNLELDGVDTQGFAATGGSSSGGGSAPTVKITSAGGTTSSAAQTVKGTVDVADAGSTVKILDGKTQIGSATVASNGAWSAAVTLANPGANVLTATDANAAGIGTSNAVTYTLQSTPTATAPTLTIAHSYLKVSGGGGTVALGVSVAAPASSTATTVAIAGLPWYESVTDHLDGRTFRGSSVTLSAAEVNSGLTLTSNYRGDGSPSATLTLTATDTIGGVTHTSAAKTIFVKDPPPASSSATAAAASGHALDLAALLADRGSAPFGHLHAASNDNAPPFGATLFATAAHHA